MSPSLVNLPQSHRIRTPAGPVVDSVRRRDGHGVDPGCRAVDFRPSKCPPARACGTNKEGACHGRSCASLEDSQAESVQRRNIAGSRPLVSCARRRRSPTLSKPAVTLKWPVSAVGYADRLLLSPWCMRRTGVGHHRIASHRIASGILFEGPRDLESGLLWKCGGPAKCLHMNLSGLDSGPLDLISWVAFVPQIAIPLAN